MIKNKEEIVVVWFKRDLRLHDNEAIFKAISSGKRVLLVYIFENILLNDPNYSERHWNFVKESLCDINSVLKQYNSKVLIVNSDIINIINNLLQHYHIKEIFSHQETGILITYERDKSFKRFCRNNQISWHENINNGVQRGIKNRNNWIKHWNDYMRQNQLKFTPNENQLLTIDDIEIIEQFVQKTDLNTPKDKPFQKGGTSTGWRYANTFFEVRHKDYMYNISKPEYSRNSCSRLSPYLAWGNLSVREIFQKGLEIKQHSDKKKHINAFLSRLRWQAHFIQKFEMEHIMENVSINKGYHKLKKSVSKHYQKAWKEGYTGFPLVDASMRCLNTTGYINFRMRAMIVSFFTHILWQPWQDAAHHLSQQFLDFEPGIHFPQLQMQAGETGINSIRIYNPTKNGIEYDKDATFIKKWVPELKDLDPVFAHEPYLMTPLEQQLNNVNLGKDYPNPIVDIKKNRKEASDVLWNLKKNSEVKKENKRILSKHTFSNRKILSDN